MIVYNTLIAIAAGAGLVGFALFLRSIRKGHVVDSEGWAGFFAVVGTLMTALGLHTAMTWPYGEGEFEYANIAFGEPPAAFGVMMLFAAVYLWRNRSLFGDGSAAAVKRMQQQVVSALKPVSIFIFVSGLMMAALTVSWVRFQLGAAPEIEPISGLFHDMPWVEAGFLGGLWGIVTVGLLLFPFALRNIKGKVMSVVITTLLVGGVIFGLFGAMNFYTHIGMYTNINKGTNYKI